MSDDLPEGWTLAQVSQLASRIQYGTSAKTMDEPRDSVPVLRMGNIVNGRLRFSNLRYLPAGHDEFPELLLQPGDLLFNRTNSPELVGKTAVFDASSPTPCSFASYLIRIRLHNYQPTLLSAFINSSRGREWIRSCVVQQVGQANVSGGKLKELEVPVPPLNEQRRIIAKLEDLLARSRRAKDALDAIPPLLEKLRQSILAAAFRGDLTADWRAKNPDVEPAEELLKRIRIERRKKWEEAELAKLRAKSKPPADDRWKAKYKEPEPVDASELPELPEGWCWASLDLCSREMTVGHVGPMQTEYVTAGIPFLRSQNVRRNGFDPSALCFISDDFHARLSKSALAPGDLVIVRTGDPGVACVIPESVRIANCSDLVIVRMTGSILPALASIYLNSDFARAHVSSEQVGVAQQHFNVGAARNMPIPVPPLAEQLRILAALSSAELTIERSTSTLRSAVAAMERLNTASLAKAFRGELVEQDPSDEPASVMLERLAAERQAAQKAPATPKRSPRQKARA